MLILTLAGRFVAWLAGATQDGSVYVVPNTSWLYRWFFKPFSVAAFTWGESILVCEAYASNVRVLRHELVHVAQARRYGIALPFLYAWYCLVAVAHGGNAYEDNKLEQEARAGE